MSKSATQNSDSRESAWGQCAEFWRRMPDKPIFFILLASWVALFHFLGNSTLGYTNTHSLFSWLIYVNQGEYSDDDIGRFIPFVVLGLVYWKRKILMDVPKHQWWPAFGLLAAALLLHALGFFVQQPRISVIAFFVGLYAIMGLVWGWHWLAAILFPFILFGLCLPLSSEADTITLPMRLWATKITSVVCGGLGINVVQDGTRIFDPSGSFQYEVAAACSGLRSLTATLTLAVIYAFVSFRGAGRRLVIIASGFPLAILANICRLTMIIVAAEAFGQSAGDYVHTSFWLSLLPYAPAFAGLAALGRLLREDGAEARVSRPRLEQPA